MSGRSSGKTVGQQGRRVQYVRSLPTAVARSERPNTSVGSTPLYKAEVGMTTCSKKFVGIDVAKDKLDIAALGEKKASQVGNDEGGIAKLIQKLQILKPELIVVEATGGYQRAVVLGLHALLGGVLLKKLFCIGKPHWLSCSS